MTSRREFLTQMGGGALAVVGGGAVLLRPEVAAAADGAWSQSNGLLPSAGAVAAIKAAGLQLPMRSGGGGVGVQAMAAGIPPIANYWVNISAKQGSLNCRIEAKQPFQWKVQVKKVSGVCRDLRTETYIYDRDTPVHFAGYSGSVPNNWTVEAIAPGAGKICYVYVTWKDGAGIFRDSLYMRGGTHA